MEIGWQADLLDALAAPGAFKIDDRAPGGAVLPIGWQQARKPPRLQEGQQVPGIKRLVVFHCHLCR